MWSSSAWIRCRTSRTLRFPAIAWPIASVVDLKSSTMAAALRSAGILHQNGGGGCRGATPSHLRQDAPDRSPMIGSGCGLTLWPQSATNWFPRWGVLPG
jgi:hypothetical protein